jgi:hypothetical protein
MTMQAEPKLTLSDTSTTTLKLPAELLAELKPHTQPKTDYYLPFKPTLFERLLGAIGLR